MDDYITKPIKKQNMVKVLRKWLSGEVDISESKSQKTEAPPSQDGTLDMEALNQVKDLMGDKFGPMVETYLENSAGYIDQAAQALKDNNAKALEDAVHPLKSSSASLGVVHVSQYAEAIENKANDVHDTGKGDLQSLSTTLKELKDAFEASREPLKKAIL